MASPSKTIVLVGMPGSGKSSIGKRLAERLHLPFRDADAAIEEAAGSTIEQIFERYGEAEFRQGEKKVIARLLDEPPCVLSTGGGAFMDGETRAAIKQKAIAVWLKADLDLLVARTARKSDRPLLKKGDPREILANLLKVRDPVFAEAAITIVCTERPLDDTVELIVKELERDRST